MQLLLSLAAFALPFQTRHIVIQTCCAVRLEWCLMGIRKFARWIFRFIVSCANRLRENYESWWESLEKT
jgi:hypothetical protein